MKASSHLRWLTQIGLVCLLLLAGTWVNAQTVRDFKTKNSTNTAERTIMLDLLRNKIEAEYSLECKFVVNHFKVSGNFAWFMGDAQRKDGKEITFEEEGANDCCHVECLFKKVNDQWTLLEYAAFATDVWYEGIGERVQAPAVIFE